MNEEEIRARIAELEAKERRCTAGIEELLNRAEAENRNFTPGEDEKIDLLETGRDRARSEMNALKSALRAMSSGDSRFIDGGEAAAKTPAQTFRGNPYAPTSQRESATEVRARALAAIERWSADDDLKQSATTKIESLRDAASGPSDIRGVSEHVLRFSDPLYISAFRKFTADPETFAAELTPDERRVWAEARDYQRATLVTSGAVLPSPLDPTIVLTNDGDVDPMRSVARTDSTTSLTKRYITSAGATFSFDAEAAEVSDDTFTESEVEITTEKAQGWIEASIEVAMDQPGFATEVAKIIADGKARLEASKFISGVHGSDEPRGIVTELTGTASEEDAAGEDIAADDVYGLLQKLPPRFRSNAVWQLELSTLNHLYRLFNPSGDEPPLINEQQLVRRPYLENSNIDPYSDINPSANGAHRPLVVGDWRNYVVLDRVGLSVHYVQPGVLKGSSGRPDGRVGWYAYWRVGARTLTTAAFQMLKVTTTE